MDRTVSDPNFAGMAVFTPVINGEFPIPPAGGRAPSPKRCASWHLVTDGFATQTQDV